MLTGHHCSLVSEFFDQFEIHHKVLPKFRAVLLIIRFLMSGVQLTATRSCVVAKACSCLWMQFFLRVSMIEDKICETTTVALYHD